MVKNDQNSFFKHMVRKDRGNGEEEKVLVVVMSIFAHVHLFQWPILLFKIEPISEFFYWFPTNKFPDNISLTFLNNKRKKLKEIIVTI